MKFRVFTMRAAPLLAILVVAAWARVHAIGANSYWFDEGVTLGMARLPFPELLRQAWNPFLNNQFLYYLALRPWHVLGESEATIRAFSALFSIGTVAVVYGLGRRLFGGVAGAVAAAVLALHPAVIRYAQEARAYSLATFLVTLAALFLVRHVETSSRRDLAGWIVFSCLALYAHFFAGLAIAAQILSLAALGLNGLRSRKTLVLGALVIAAAEAPIASFFLLVPKGLVGWVPPMSAEKLAYIGAFLAGGRALLLLPFLAAFVVAAVIALRAHDVTKRWALTLALSWALLPTLAMAAVSLRQPILLERYVLMSVPAFALGLGAVASALSKRGWIASLAVAAVLASVAVVDMGVLRNDVYADHGEDWRTVAEEVAVASRPGDVVLYDSAWGGLTFDYYLDRAGRGPRRLQPGPLLFDGAFDAHRAQQSERVWLVLSREDENRVTRLASKLGETHPVVSARTYGGDVIRVILFDVVRRAPGAGAFGY